MPENAKHFARAILPKRLYSTLMSVRSRNHQLRLFAADGLLEISAAIAYRYGDKVLRGPFAGMQYPREALLDRHATPKLLGSYEQELHCLFACIQDRRYRKIIDIGCAEGYYAVGLALLAHLPVHAYDPDPRERALCARMAVQNGVAEQITIEAWCDAKRLCALVEKERCFIVSDCEGYELELFTSETVQHLSYSDLVVEVHDRAGVDVHETLRARFEGTHYVRTVIAAQRDAARYAELQFLGTAASKAISEYRVNGCRWLQLIAKSVATLSRTTG